jgi:hypothetical protein
MSEGLRAETCQTIPDTELRGRDGSTPEKTRHTKCSTPDHIGSFSRDPGKHSKGVQWWQNWEYDRRIDNRWETFRLTFCQETDGYKITERMRIDPYWQITDERVARYLYL